MANALLIRWSKVYRYCFAYLDDLLVASADAEQ